MALRWRQLWRVGSCFLAVSAARVRWGGGQGTPELVSSDVRPTPSDEEWEPGRASQWEECWDPRAFGETSQGQQDPGRGYAILPAVKLKVLPFCKAWTGENQFSTEPTTGICRNTPCKTGPEFRATWPHGGSPSLLPIGGLTSSRSRSSLAFCSST